MTAPRRQSKWSWHSGRFSALSAALAFAAVVSACDDSSGGTHSTATPPAPVLDPRTTAPAPPPSTPASDPGMAPTAPRGSGSRPPPPRRGGPFPLDPTAVTTATPAAFIPDHRPAVLADTPPPPISGGTLFVASDGVTAVASDPDRDRVSIVDIRSGDVQHIALEPGDEPGRAVEDSDRRAHVILRRGSAIATIELDTARMVGRVEVCATPRGIAYDSTRDQLYVACMSGELVALPPAGGPPTRTQFIAPDLRDVVVHAGRVRLTQFKTAALLELDDEWGIVSRYRGRPHSGQTFFPRIAGSGAQRMESGAAFRAIALRDGSTAILHTRAMSDEFKLPSPVTVEALLTGQISLSIAAYGTESQCDGLVYPVVSVVDANGTITAESVPLSRVALGVDIAASFDGSTLAVANPAPPAHDAPPPIAVGTSIGSFPSVPSIGVALIARSELSRFTNSGSDCALELGSYSDPQATSVAFTPDGTLLVQTREPARLVLHSSDASRVIELGGASCADSGHETFHVDPGARVACASCHIEGADDGRIWHFSDVGPHRTQSLDVGLPRSGPLRWNGDKPDLAAYVEQQFVDRMGGTPPGIERTAALDRWLSSLRPPPPIRRADDEAAQRGKALFERDALACTTCHAGARFTSDESHDVGTGAPLRVPSLRGIGYRAPYMHSGCGGTLGEALTPACFGTQHGDLSTLTDTERDDLVAYMQSL